MTAYNLNHICLFKSIEINLKNAPGTFREIANAVIVKSSVLYIYQISLIYCGKFSVSFLMFYLLLRVEY